MLRLAIHNTHTVDPAQTRGGRFFFPIIAIGTAALLAASFAVVFAPGSWASHWPWAVGLVLFIMPHGAYDWRLLRQQASPVRTLILYTVIMSACAAAYVASPLITTLAFFALTIHHFGSGDVHRTLPLDNRAKVSNTIERWCRGLVLLSGTFAAAPEAAWSPFATLSTLVRVEPIMIDPALASRSGFVLLGIGLMLACAALRRGVRCGASQASWSEFAITLGVAVLALTTPPLFAVGLYILCVHAPLHCLSASHGHTPLARIRTAHLAGLPFLVPAIAAVVLLAWPLGGVADPAALPAAFIGFCMISTLPHHMLAYGRLGFTEPALPTAPGHLQG